MSLHFLTEPIFGAPHMHQRRPDASYYIGDVSPQGDPLRCSQAVLQLYGYYADKRNDDGRPMVETVPLVINTNGWIQVCLP